MYVIGDVHGCYLTLKAIIEKIGINEDIYSLGDLVDKGPDTCKVLDYVQSLENFKMVLGNHELKFIEHMEEYVNGIDIKNTKWYLSWGGKESFASYSHIINEEEKKIKIKSHLKYLKKQKFYFYFKKERIFLSHGFALPYFNKRFKISEPLVQKEFTSNRLYGHHFNMKNKENIDFLKSINVLNIFGHDANNYVIYNSSYIDIDTGCVYGNKLTSYNTITKECLSIKCIDKVNYKD